MLDNDLVLKMMRRYGDLDDAFLNQIAREFGVAPSTLIQMVRREGDWSRDWIGSRLRVIREFLAMLDRDVAELEQEYAALKEKYQRKAMKASSPGRAG